MGTAAGDREMGPESEGQETNGDRDKKADKYAVKQKT